MMKHLLYWLCLFIASPVLAGPFSPAAGQPGSVAIHMDDPTFLGWASGWQDYLAGSDVDTSFQTPNKALGKAIGDSFDIVSLGRNGKITLKFTHPIKDGNGADFAVFSNSFNDTFLELAWVEVSSDGTQFFRFNNISLTPSPVGSFSSVDPTNITGYAGKHRAGYGTPFDLNELAGNEHLDLDNIQFVRLIDIVGNGTAFDDFPANFGGPKPIFDPYPTVISAGFDLEAVGVIHQNVTAPPVEPMIVPLPSYVVGWLIIFFIFIRFRKSYEISSLPTGVKHDK